MLIKNRIYETEITSYTSEGSGVGKIDGIAVFVPMSSLGDVLRVKIIKTVKSYAVGKIEEIIKKSPYRKDAECSVYEKCGGCSLMHESYAHQLEIKKQQVKDALMRLGGFKDVRLEDTLPATLPFCYRNKMVFPIGGEKGNAVGGFYATKSHRIIPLKNCFLGDSLATDALLAVLNYVNEEKIEPYNEEDHTGNIRRLMIRTAKNTEEAMAVISVKNENLPNKEKLINALLNIKNEKYRFVSIIINVNKEKNNLVLGEKNIVIYGKSSISDSLLGIKFKISPHSFFQVNPVQTENLYQKAIEFACLKGKETVLDLYCGAGTISLACAQKAKKVIGVEIVPEAIKDAKFNAENNTVKNVEFILGEAEKIAPQLAYSGIKPDVIIVDPPRKGLDNGTISAIGEMMPPRIVYVSCNPSTLARDLAKITEFGYKINIVQPVDMFPQTAHVECVVLLCRI